MGLRSDKELRTGRKHAFIPSEGPLFAGMDCGSECVSVAIERDGVVLFERRELHTNPKGSSITLLLSEGLESLGLELSGLSGLAVTLGPGSFTGVRLNLMAAKTLATVFGIPLVGTESTRVLAERISSHGPVAVAMDARMGEVYLALYDGEPGGRKVIMTPRAMPAQEAADLLEAERSRLAGLHLVGSGFAAYPCLLAMREVAKRRIRLDDFPSPSVLLALARPRLLAGEGDDVMTLEPFYVRRFEVAEKKAPSKLLQ